MQISSDTLILRSAKSEDVDRLLELSALVGSGMTSMPTDRQSWIDKLQRSNDDFAATHARKSSDIYFMVLEDLKSEKIVGCCAVYAGVGVTQPFYSYKISTITTSSEKLGLTIHTQLLNLVNDFTGTTEIGSLFLLPEYRRDGIGKFLSRSRFLLLADFPERFDETVFAEMRGWLDENTSSPFWEHLGHKFFDLTFQEADFISAVDGHQFISDLMPKTPVYLDLLPQVAQDVVGKPHDDAAAALHILKKEGFAYSGYVDIFDAGPTVKTQLDKISTVADSKSTTIAKIVDDSTLENADQYIFSNSNLADYRITRSGLNTLSENQIEVSSTAASALKLKIGDPIRIVKG